jgi:hypothetical protein
MIATTAVRDKVARWLHFEMGKISPNTTPEIFASEYYFNFLRSFSYYLDMSNQSGLQSYGARRNLINIVVKTTEFVNNMNIEYAGIIKPSLLQRIKDIFFSPIYL